MCIASATLYFDSAVGPPRQGCVISCSATASSLPTRSRTSAALWDSRQVKQPNRFSTVIVDFIGRLMCPAAEFGAIHIVVCEELAGRRLKLEQKARCIAHLETRADVAHWRLSNKHTVPTSTYTMYAPETVALTH